MILLTTKISMIISEIDHIVSRQMDEILHHHSFKNLESSWRNLWYLTKNTPKQNNVKISLFSLSKTELSNDVLRSLEFDQSQLFDIVYSRGFGISGGEPFGIIIGDYYFSNNPKDTQTLHAISEVASAAFCPFILGASEDLFGIDNFSDMGDSPDIFSVFQQKEYTSWQSLRSQTDARFLSLVLPRHLLRLPYSRDAKIFQYHESNSELSHLWGNAVYAFALIVIRSFIHTGWFGNIQGDYQDDESGGIVPAVNSINNSPSDLLITDVFITDNQEKELSELGFIALCQKYPGGKGVFYSGCSIQNNAKSSGLLRYLLCACRFAHYLKVMMRDQIGNTLTPTECEDKLNTWLLHYVAANEDLGEAKRAKFPLQNGLVKVFQSSGVTDNYYCQVYLKPFFQLEQLHTEFIFTTKIPFMINHGA